MASHSSNGNATLEDGLRDTVSRLQGTVSEQIRACEESVRKSPTNSVLVAALVGFFLHVLPIGALLGAIVRLITALIRPAIVLYVAAKALDVVRSSTATTGGSAPDEGAQATS